MKKADSYVFYHDQDADRLREHGECHLSWGGDTAHIVRRLKEAGLSVEWDGTAHTRIKVSAAQGH